MPECLRGLSAFFPLQRSIRAQKYDRPLRDPLVSGSVKCVVAGRFLIAVGRLPLVVAFWVRFDEGGACGRSR